MSGSVIIGTLFEILSIFGLLLTTSFLVSLIRHGYLKSDVPFTIIFNLSVSYFCHLCIVAFHTGPEVILGHDPFSEELERAAKYFYLCFWYVTLFSQILMTSNRYVAACQFQAYKKFFNLCQVRFLCILSWVMGLLVAAVPELGLCCPLVFSTHVVRSLGKRNGTAESSHSSAETESSHEEMDKATELTNFEVQTNWMLIITHVVNMVTISIMVCFYVLILLKVKQVHAQVVPQDGSRASMDSAMYGASEVNQPSIGHIAGVAGPSRHSSTCGATFSQQQQQHQTRVRRISFQAFTLSFCFTIFSIFQILVHFVFTTVTMMLILQLSHLINCSVIPIVFLILNSKIRHEMITTLCFVQKVPEPEPAIALGQKGNNGKNNWKAVDNKVHRNIFVSKAVNPTIEI